MKVVLFHHLQKGNAPEVARKVCLALHRNGMEVWADPRCLGLLGDMSFICYAPFLEAVQDADVAVAIGGDGTILHCARHVVGTKAKLLGINTGRLGFLASMEPDQIGEIARLQTGDYRVSKRMLLRGKVLDKTGTCLRELTALNDIVISRNFSRVIEFTVSRNNVVLGEYRADGVIFSTPTGSTAYALSAGGPIIEPEFSCIEMNLICPHSLSARPILFSPHNDLQVSLRVREEYDAYFCADGEKPEPFPEGRVMEISGSDQTLEILDLSGNTFFDSLSRKLMQSLKAGRTCGTHEEKAAGYHSFAHCSRGDSHAGSAAGTHGGTRVCGDAGNAFQRYSGTEADQGTAWQRQGMLYGTGAAGSQRRHFAERRPAYRLCRKCGSDPLPYRHGTGSGGGVRCHASGRCGGNHCRR